MPIPLVTADSPNMKCPSGGVVVLPSRIGSVAKINGIPIVDIPDSTWSISGCQGHPLTTPPQYRQYCSSVVNPTACKAEKFKVLGYYVADAEKVDKLKTDKGFNITLPSPIAKPFVKQ